MEDKNNRTYNKSIANKRYENDARTTSAFLHIAHIRNVRSFPGKRASGSRDVAATEWMLEIARHVQ